MKLFFAGLLSLLISFNLYSKDKNIIWMPTIKTPIEFAEHAEFKTWFLQNLNVDNSKLKFTEPQPNMASKQAEIIVGFEILDTRIKFYCQIEHFNGLEFKHHKTVMVEKENVSKSFKDGFVVLSALVSKELNELFLSPLEISPDSLQSIRESRNLYVPYKVTISPMFASDLGVAFNKYGSGNDFSIKFAALVSDGKASKFGPYIETGISNMHFKGMQSEESNDIAYLNPELTRLYYGLGMDAIVNINDNIYASLTGGVTIGTAFFTSDYLYSQTFYTDNVYLRNIYTDFNSTMTKMGAGVYFKLGSSLNCKYLLGLNYSYHSNLNALDYFDRNYSKAGLSFNILFR